MIFPSSFFLLSDEKRGGLRILTCFSTLDTVHDCSSEWRLCRGWSLRSTTVIEYATVTCCMLPVLFKGDTFFT